MQERMLKARPCQVIRGLHHTPTACKKLQLVSKVAAPSTRRFVKSTTLHHASHCSSATNRIPQVQLSLYDKDAKPLKLFSIQDFATGDEQQEESCTQCAAPFCRENSAYATASCRQQSDSGIECLHRQHELFEEKHAAGFCEAAALTLLTVPACKLCLNGWTSGGYCCGSGMQALPERMDSGWTLLRFRHGCLE